jgi:hypothetical protein
MYEGQGAKQSAAPHRGLGARKLAHYRTAYHGSLPQAMVRFPVAEGPSKIIEKAQGLIPNGRPGPVDECGQWREGGANVAGRTPLGDYPD